VRAGVWSSGSLPNTHGWARLTRCMGASLRELMGPAV
jgi:hypothetical protein